MPVCLLLDIVMPVTCITMAKRRRTGITMAKRSSQFKLKYKFNTVISWQ
jgi:hypothetical protein